MTNNKTKKRLLIANDASFIGSGYGVYGKELISRLHNSGKYDVAELGCYAEVNHREIQSVPWKFYPNAVSSKDERIGQYKENNINQFGAWRFNRCLLDFKPHIVFDVRDYWMSAYQEITPLRKHFHWIIMPTADSAPLRYDWLYTFCSADVVVPYTDWAKKILFESCGDKINLFPKIANAGIDPKQFYPIEDKASHKKQFLGSDYNVIGLVMRNQKRKLIPDILIAYKQYLNSIKETNPELYDNTILYLHTSYPEENGWDLPSLLLEHGLINRVYFTYSCRKCQNIYPAKFKGSIVKCNKCGQLSSSMAGVSNSIPTQELNKIYNLFDIFIQYAICEGFGMPQIEAAACGVPIASVDYSAMTEIVEKLDGYKIPVARMFRELETNADRAYPDIGKTVDILRLFFIDNSSEYRYNKGKKTRDLCVDYYTWDNTYKVWDECFDSVDISKKKSWDDTSPSLTNHGVSVPNNLNPQDFIEFICNNILLEPELVRTSYCQSLIKDLTSIISTKNGVLGSMTYQDVVNRLDAYLNNKLSLEQGRLLNNIQKEDFLICQKK
jgi:glycosyltransferase involved in cell wall biosynthesis